MDAITAAIREAIEADRVVFSIHADNQLATRNVERWQAVAGFAEGRVIRAEAHARPNAKVLVEQTLPDGVSVIAVWAYVRSMRAAKLVTLYFPYR